MQKNLILCTLLCLASPIAASGFDRSLCLQAVLAALNDTNIEELRSAFFDRGVKSFNTSTGMVLKPEYFLQRADLNATYPTLSRKGCTALCSHYNRWYPDIGQRFMIWLLPVVLIMANYEVSPLDRYKNVELLLLVGNPLDINWSLLAKAEAWRSCFYIAKENIQHIPGLTIQELGVILAAIFEITGPTVDPLKVFIDLVHRGDTPFRGTSSLSQTDIEFLKSVAHDISDSRINNVMRTLFSMVLYGLQLVSAFVTILGGGIKGNGSPPGGRIGTAMLLTWLIPSVLLSNTIGGFTTRRNCFTVMTKLVDFFSDDQSTGDGPSPLPDSNQLVTAIRNPDHYFSHQRWIGGTDGYRPQKVVTFGKSSKWRQHFVFVLSVAPILVSCITSSIILWYSPPHGFNCRNGMILFITSIWLFSCFLSWLTWATGLFRGRAHWTFTVIKDIHVSIPVMLTIFLSSAGVFNDCDCWSAQIWLKNKACVPLNWESEYETMNNTVYPGLAGACVGFQIILFFIMLAFEWRGLRLMRWRESVRQARYVGLGVPLRLRVRKAMGDARGQVSRSLVYVKGFWSKQRRI